MKKTDVGENLLERKRKRGMERDRYGKEKETIFNRNVYGNRGD